VYLKAPYRSTPYFSLLLLACPFGHGLVGAARASMLALKTGVKIIDFLRHSIHKQLEESVFDCVLV